MKQGLLITATVGIMGCCTPAFADDAAEVAALKKEVKALEARINELEKREQKPTQYTAQPTAPADATLAKRVAVVEHNQKVVQEQEAKKPDVAVNDKGLTITSPDKQYSLNLHGYVQADNRTFLGGGAKNGTTDTFLIRSARPIIEAKMTDYFGMRFMMDFGKGQTTLLDAYGDFHPMPGTDYINLRAGEFKSPVGLERWQNESKVLFVERGQTTNLVPYRDVGVMLYGNPVPKQLEYELALLNGAADLQANTGTDNDNKKDVAGRIFTHPLAWINVQALKGLGLGVGGTYGIHQGNTAIAANGGLTAGYVTVGQRAYFTYAAGSFADGAQWRVNPQAMYYNGPFSLLGEYVMNSQEIGHGANVATLENKAWEGIATYVLTGEDASFEGVKPAHNFNPKAGDWGAFELVGRVSELNVDRQAFPNFASLTTSSRQAFERTLGGTWYFNPWVKLNLDFSYTTFEAGAAGGADHADEKAVMTRTQVRF